MKSLTEKDALQLKLIYYNIFNTIIFMFQKTRHSEAEHWFTKANEIAPEDPNVHMHYGFFLLDTERNLEAGIQFEKAVQIRPQDYESNFNAGVAFRLAGKNDLAEKFYRQALQLRPQVC
jgi:Tfp pilus assembly protein PilF